MRHLDLFSGIGGFSLAAQWAGYETVAFCEENKWCCDNALKKNWPDIPIFNDVRKLYRFADEYDICPDCEEPYCSLCENHFWECECVGCSEFDDEVGNIDIITAGVPCQPASIIGKRKGAKDSRWLWPDTLRIVRSLKPKWFIGENPTGLLTLDGGERFSEIIEGFQQAGYSVWWETIPCSAVGGSHRRERVWIVAYSDSERLERHTGDGKTLNRQKWKKEEQARPTAQKIVLPVRNGSQWWKDKSPVPIMVDGVSDYSFWKSAVIATGNAIVPQVAYEIMKATRELSYG